MRSAARAVHEAVEALGVERADLLVHDVGGWVAYPYLREFGGDVGRAVVVDILLPGFGLEEDFDEGFWYLFGQTPYAAELVAGQEARFFGLFWDFARPGTFDATDRAEFLSGYTRPGSLDAGFAYYRDLPAARRHARRTRAPRLGQPILTIAGERSLGARMGREFRAIGRRVTSRIAPGTTHWVPDERPGLVARETLRFLRR